MKILLGKGHMSCLPSLKFYVCIYYFLKNKVKALSYHIGRNGLDGYLGTKSCKTTDT